MAPRPLNRVTSAEFAVLFVGKELWSDEPTRKQCASYACNENSSSYNGRQLKSQYARKSTCNIIQIYQTAQQAVASDQSSGCEEQARTQHVCVLRNCPATSRFSGLPGEYIVEHSGEIEHGEE